MTAESITPGRIIFLNGASSSGKSTLARGLQDALPEAFWHISIDHLNAAKVLPQARIKSGEFEWQRLRPAFFDGFHRCLPQLAAAGNNVIVDHIIETDAWMRYVVRLLADADVFFVGVHCPLAELERRERARGDRRIGEARTDFQTVNSFGEYDFAVDATLPLAGNVSAVIDAWLHRQRPSAFQRMQRHFQEFGLRLDRIRMPPSDLILRQAKPEDAPAIAACVCHAYVDYIERIGKQPGPMLEDYSEIIRKFPVHVAELDRKIVGAIVLKITSDGFYVDNVAVLPSVKGQGVGRRLLQLAETEARRQGYASICLATHELMTENRALYSRVGYAEYDHRVVNGYPRVYFRKALS